LFEKEKPVESFTDQRVFAIVVPGTGLLILHSHTFSFIPISFISIIYE